MLSNCLFCSTNTHNSKDIHFNITQDKENQKILTIYKPEQANRFSSTLNYNVFVILDYINPRKEFSEYIIFVEVKTRSSAYWGNPEEAVSATKIKRIVAAADLYLNEKNINKPARFDVIAVVINKGSIDIEHIEDAFFAPLN